MSITKQQAALLFSFDFKLVDKKGNEWSIHNPIEDYGLSIYPTKGGMHDREIIYSQIGTDYHILAYHHSCLTKEVNGVIPFLELENEFRQKGYWVDLSFELWTGYAMFSNESLGQYHGVPAAFFERLYQMHFLPHGIEEINVKYIND